MNRIKELRTKRKLNQKELAKIASVSPSSLSGYETEQFEASIQTYITLADYFGVSLDYLLGRDADTAAPVQLPPPFPEITERYAKLSDMDRIRVQAYIDGILSGAEYQTGASVKSAG